MKFFHENGSMWLIGSNQFIWHIKNLLGEGQNALYTWRWNSCTPVHNDGNITHNDKIFMITALLILTSF